MRSLRGKSLTPENANEYIKKLEDDYNIIRAHVDDMVLMMYLVLVSVNNKRMLGWLSGIDSDLSFKVVIHHLRLGRQVLLHS